VWPATNLRLQRWQVTAIYLTLHKKEVLNKVSDSVARVDIAQIAEQIDQEEESADKSGLYENVKRVHDINKAVCVLSCRVI
jgi:hypothetical protein